MKCLYKTTVGLQLLIGLAIGSCGAPPPVETINKPAIETEPEGDEPGFEIASFAVFNKANKNRVLPYPSKRNGDYEDSKCFVTISKPKTWETKNKEVIRQIDLNKELVRKSIQAWLTEDIANNGDNSFSIADWQMEFEGLTISHYQTDKVRLSDDQECIEDSSHSLSTHAKVVTTLFGATEYRFKSETPMDPDLIKKLRNGAKKAKIVFQTVKTYKKAKDEKGRPIFKKGKPLFVAPNGQLIPQKQVPPPKKRPVFEAVIKLDKVLYFAYGDMTPTLWSKEVDPIKCNINLVFDDITPRIPECAELKDAGFGVSPGKDASSVIVKMSADDSTVSVPTPFGETVKLQTGGRVVAWVTPKEIPEGATLIINTLVLNPSDAPIENLKAFKFGQ